MTQGACFCLSLCFLVIISPCFSYSGKIKLETTQHEDVYPTTPVAILPANNPPPTIVTVPSTNPVTPITNPVTTPSTTTPVSNPVTTYPSPTSGVPATTPVTNPVAPPAPAVPGQSWCVVKNGVSEAGIQAALDYACGMAGADCSAIQQGASCYNPNSLKNHASYALNSYYQKNPVQTSCDFGGTGMITTTNPSSGTCVYPASSSPLSSTTPSPTTTSSGGGLVSGSATPPSVLNSGNPASVDGTSNSSTSMSLSLQPLMGFIILATFTITGRFTLYI